MLELEAADGLNSAVGLDEPLWVALSGAPHRAER